MRLRREANSIIDCVGKLDAVLIHSDGSSMRLDGLSGSQSIIHRPLAWWRAMWESLRSRRIIPLTLGLAAFMALYGANHPQAISSLIGMAGLVTTTGANFLAADMASGQATPRISSMNFHDSGTGVTAAAIGDSALQTQAGPATRATGTQSNPSANVYKTVGTIAYVSTLAITEWGVFNQAAQGGTMWDHRVFAAINVVSGDSVQYSYSLTVNSGGS